MAHKVYFRDEAAAELNAIYDYIANQGSPRATISYMRRIQETCLALSDFPEQGTKRDDILPGLRTLGFERRTTIAFRVLKARVEIVTIAYGGRDFESRLRERR